MNERLLRWNERYERGEETFSFAPSPPLPEAIHGVLPGRALDLACGAGRHALFLAERGWQVVAVDGARAAIDLLAAEAERRGVADRVDLRVADLMSRPRGFDIDEDGYDLVLDFYFLDRTLFEAIRRGVRPGGMFVAAIHVTSAGEPHDRLLEPGELARTVSAWGWEIRLEEEGASREGGHDHASAWMIARRP